MSIEACLLSESLSFLSMLFLVDVHFNLRNESLPLSVPPAPGLGPLGGLDDLDGLPLADDGGLDAAPGLQHRHLRRRQARQHRLTRK